MSIPELTDSQDSHERRHGVCPIPLNLNAFLNEEQRCVLGQIENFGWQLAFVRRPLFQEPMVVIKNADGSNFSVLEKDGTIDPEPPIVIRH